MRRSRGAAPAAEQLDIGFEGVEVVEPPVPEPAPDTMRQIVSLRMPDALLARVEQSAASRGRVAIEPDARLHRRRAGSVLRGGP